MILDSVGAPAGTVTANRECMHPDILEAGLQRDLVRGSLVRELRRLALAGVELPGDLRALLEVEARASLRLADTMGYTSANGEHESDSEVKEGACAAHQD